MSGLVLRREPKICGAPVDIPTQEVRKSEHIALRSQVLFLFRLCTRERYTVNMQVSIVSCVL